MVVSGDKNVLASKIPSFPIPKISLGQYMLNCLRHNGTGVAQIDAETGEEISFREILEKSIRLAESLKKRGLQIGDRIAISSENHIGLLIPTLASLYLGAVVAPLNSSYAKSELLHALGISKPSIIFVSELTEKIVKEVTRDLNPKPQLIQLSSKKISHEIPILSDILAETEPIVDLNDFSAVDFPDHGKQLAAILCSSGTTGLPKGVMLSHRNLMTLFQHYRHPEIFAFRPDLRVLVFVPFFHGYGFSLFLAMAATGGTAILLRGFEPTLFLNAVQKYRAATVPLVPSIMVFLAKHPIVDQFDLSSINDITCGAAPLSNEILTAVSKRLGVSSIRQAFGMTETTVVSTFNPKSNNKVGSVGVLLPDTFCKIVDTKTSKSLGPLELGEICFAGDLVMMGYCGNPEATAEAIDPQGWLRTGDIGYYDEEGYIYVVDRIKELIKYKGFQVPPAELEAILLRHPGIKEAAVIGLEDEDAGELPLAFVVRQPGADVSPGEIRQYVDEQVNPSKRLRGGVRFIEDLPKNTTGKILRRELRKLVSKL